jgi:threonine synthase
MKTSCNNCRHLYPPEGIPYRCPICGGIYGIQTPILFDPSKVDELRPGMWRYHHTFGLALETTPVTLGEGNTPLVWVDVFNRKVAFKCEYLNPSGSFKDRGSALIVAWLQTRGILDAVEDSSGNAGSSLAAYAARAGIRVHIYVPENASDQKRRQIEAYGADLVSIPGTRSDAAKAVQKVAEEGVVYASHAYLPFNIPGYATAAYEIFEQLGNVMPGAVIVPVGQGGLLLGLARGFDALRIAHHITGNIPRIIGVQARACAPLWARLMAPTMGEFLVAENNTLAEGVRVSKPVREPEILSAIRASQGTIIATDEIEILAGRDALARLGFYVEPTSAIVWSALMKLRQELPDPVVIILTGSGYKTINLIKEKYHGRYSIFWKEIDQQP